VYHGVHGPEQPECRVAEDVGQLEAERVWMAQRLAQLGGLGRILLGLQSGLPVLRALVDEPRRGLYRLARTQHGAWAIAQLEAIAHLQGRLGRIVELSEPTLRAREAAPSVAPLAPQRADEVTVLRERWDRCKPPP